MRHSTPKSPVQRSSRHAATMVLVARKIAICLQKRKLLEGSSISKWSRMSRDVSKLPAWCSMRISARVILGLFQPSQSCLSRIRHRRSHDYNDEDSVYLTNLYSNSKYEIKKQKTNRVKVVISKAQTCSPEQYLWLFKRIAILALHSLRQTCSNLRDIFTQINNTLSLQIFISLSFFQVNWPSNFLLNFSIFKSN